MSSERRRRKVTPNSEEGAKGLAQRQAQGLANGLAEGPSVLASGGPRRPTGANGGSAPRGPTGAQRYGPGRAGDSVLASWGPRGPTGAKRHGPGRPRTSVLARRIVENPLLLSLLGGFLPFPPLMH